MGQPVPLASTSGLGKSITTELCSVCDDTPGMLPPEVPHARPDPDHVQWLCLVPFPPPEPAEMWRLFAAAFDAQADAVEKEMVRVVRDVSRLRASVRAAAFSAAIGSTSASDLHRQAVASWAVLLSDCAAFIRERNEIADLYQFDADAPDLRHMCEHSRAWHRAHKIGGAG